MYRINRLKRNVLITPDEVLFHIASDQNVSERQILQNIIVAEERFIASTICDEFYYDFINKKNKKVTAENQAQLVEKINESLTVEGAKTIVAKDLPIGTIVNAIEFVDNPDYVELWEMFLWKATAECVDFMATVPSWLRHTSLGQQMNSPKQIGGNSTESASGEMRDIKFKLDNTIQDRINPFLERMEKWICKRKNKFQLYCKECPGCGAVNGDGISNVKNTNFILGIYEDD